MSSTLLAIHQPQLTKVPSTYDVVVVGAGPYGLSVAAHLLGHGLKVAAFGKPNNFWRYHMPEGMLLRSYWWATSMSDYNDHYGFGRYLQERGIPHIDPVPAQAFIDYGLWFQQQAVPHLDQTYVRSIVREDGQFLVTLEDGRELQSKAVVMAPGLHYYTYIPPEYAHMPSTLVSHSSNHHAMDIFAGQRVVIVGRGQGALETAALLHEHDADVHVITRHPIRWLQVSNSRIPPLLRDIRAPRAGMGSGWLNFMMERNPYSFCHLPQKTKDHLLETRHGPAGSHWLRPRVENKVSITENVQVQKVEEVGERARMRLSDGSVLEADHVILGTGYRADIRRLPMLDAVLVGRIRTHKGSPVLNSRFESSVPGLYFVGYSAARSLGFLYRFVIGSDAAARRVASAVAQHAVHVG